MLFWGVHKLSLEKFLLADIVGCAAWAGLLGTVGFSARRVLLWVFSSPPDSWSDGTECARYGGGEAMSRIAAEL
jgi:hypothetical protein